MGLQRYFEKRNFRRTPEPKGRTHRPKAPALSFVIQKHDARRLHYDFRLEIEGVLKSWAVPKGVPTKKGDKRLAMHVEDHPIEYGGFEGTIPEGNYGAGTVMLWDRGHYEVIDSAPPEAYEKGKIHLRLHGKKVNGEWTLVRMRGREEAGKEPWLLIKSGEDVEPISAKTDDESVSSRRTMDQIAHGKSKVWQSNRAEKSTTIPAVKLGTKRATRAGSAPSPSASRLKAEREEEKSGLKAARRNFMATLEEFPKQTASYVDPMKALLVEKVSREPGWMFEIKWDGYRAVAVKKNGEVRLFSRRPREITSDFSEIAQAVKQIPVSSLVLDGEVVAVDKQGHASFQLLQNFRQRRGGPNASELRYYVFDILNLENRDLKSLPLERRKKILESLLKDVPAPIHFSASFEGDPEALLAQAQRNRIEGLIAKRADSQYEPGRRSGAWVKIKASLEQEFVIGGYTEPRGSRPYFGALLLGYYEEDQLMFASKVGTGFDTKTLKGLSSQFQKVRTDSCPFTNVPTRRTGRSGEGLSRAEMKRCTWLEPKLVCQIRFTEWTSDGGLRHPVFLGLRDDKTAREVVHERPAPSRAEDT
jgi:bifunctional non-homologous end joining protein LigD